MATTTTTRKATTAKKPVAKKPTATATTVRKPVAKKPVAKATPKTAARKPAARKPAAPKKTVVSASVVEEAPVTAAGKAAEEGVLTRFFTFTFDYVGDATSLGGNVFGAIPGLPQGVAKKLASAQSKVMKGTTGQIESVTVASASALGKGLSTLTAPIRKLVR